MSSVIQVANRALTKLGAGRITSLADDIKAARDVQSCFDDLRDDELRARRWQFSIRRVSLPALVDAPAFGWNYQYQLPADCLKIDMINDQFPAGVLTDYIGSEMLEWTIENNRVLTNFQAPLKVRYIAQVTDPAQWDPGFREVLACRIAAELAESLTQSNQKRQLAWEEYQLAVRKALRSNAVERPPVMLNDEAWILSRV
jgi:hypothetical protein